MTVNKTTFMYLLTIGLKNFSMFRVTTLSRGYNSQTIHRGGSMHATSRTKDLFELLLRSLMDQQKQLSKKSQLHSPVHKDCSGLLIASTLSVTEAVFMAFFDSLTQMVIACSIMLKSSMT